MHALPDTRRKGSRGRKRSLYGVSALAVAALVALAVAGERRPPLRGAAPSYSRSPAGSSERPVDPGDLRDSRPTAADQSVQRAPAISADIDTISAWWRSQDYARVPRFDVTTFACGRAGGYRPRAAAAVGRRPRCRSDTRFIERSSRPSTRRAGAPHSKYLVYYDGPVATATSAVKAGAPVTAGCGDRLPRSLPPYRVRGGRGARAHARLRSAPRYRAAARLSRTRLGHPCDSTGDLLYPYVPFAQLAVFGSTSGTTTTTRTPAAGSTCRTRPGCATSRRRRPCSP